ncbi:hypothetical protein G6M85_22605 [Agrobacterium tumefaciens]|uniref:hypothetical protein n=1 Tax=Agrobacterium tumefaciens TaxID=358 RepID=UPI00157471A0|nr:hypothetical protein [Agrobacterium tumefaciens]NTE68389.1 hypothetical protein [Agrobacterium tumefaciens]
MSADKTIHELERLGSVQDALMKRLEDELREMRAASDEIDAYLYGAIAARAARTIMLVEARRALEDADSGCPVLSLARYRRPTLRTVQ